MLQYSHAAHWLCVYLYAYEEGVKGATGRDKFDGWRFKKTETPSYRVMANMLLSTLEFERRGIPGLLDGLGLGASCPSSQHGHRCTSIEVDPI